MSEANKKTPRTFQCRNVLWATFEEMARGLECSVDYLINDAMKQYARQRGYAKDLPSAVSLAPPNTPLPSSTPSGAPPPPPQGARAPGPPPAPSGAKTQPFQAQFPGPGRLPPPGLAGGGSGAFPHPAPPLPPGASRGPLSPGTAPPGAAPPGVAPPRPPLPPAARATSGLTLHFEGHAYPVTKDRFVIGRGKANSDLTIRDPNVSRQHAVVEFSGGTYYIVDMGSTNGIEFRGQRVQRKAIQNGDVFRICDHDVFCSLG